MLKCRRSVGNVHRFYNRRRCNGTYMWEVLSSACVIVVDQHLALWSFCVAESAYTMGANTLNKYCRKKPRNYPMSRSPCAHA